MHAVRAFVIPAVILTACQSIKPRVHTADTVQARVPHNTYHPNGRKHAEGHLLNGLRDGRWSAWDSDGRKLWEGHYHAGQLQGPYVYWVRETPEGPATGPPPREEGEFKQNARHGRWIRWWPRTKQIHTVMTWARGSREGPFESFHENGRKEDQGQYAHNEKDGQWISWHDNGQKSSQGFWQNGRLVGMWTYWHPNGKKWSEGTYELDPLGEGKRHGV